MEADIDLIQRCQQGDKHAFEDLYKSCQAKALRTVYLITKQPALSEEIVQESFIQCYHELRSLRKPETFQTWFYRILVRMSWRLMKRERKLPSIPFDPFGGNKQEPVAHDDVDSIIEQKQMNQTVYQALDQLNEHLRTTVILHYFNDLSLKEIAEVLHCPEGTVKSRLHSAKKQLAAELAKHSQISFFNHESKKISIQNEKEFDVNAT